MKSSTLTESIATFHAGKTLVYIACAGAGAGCQNILSRVPGASNTILECLFPYSNEALADFLGERPGKSASLQTAINMATRAWLRGRDLARKRGADPDRVVGLGLTAVVATNRALRGEHRVFIARRSSAGLFSLQAFFGKNAQGLSVLGRERECDLCDIFAVNMLLDHAGIAQVSFPTAALKSDDILDREGEGTLRIREYVSPESPKEAAGNNVVVMPDGQKVPVATLSPSQYVLFPGSFNPLHSGHEQIAGEVTQSTGKTVVYTINLDHPVKGSLTDEESECRVKQFEWRAPVLITRGLPLFLDKAEAFPGFSFILGVDALSRMLDPRYYNISIADMFKRFKELGVHFFVARRDLGEGIASFADLAAGIPAEYRSLFSELRVQSPLSSTSIRSSIV